MNRSFMAVLGTLLGLVSLVALLPTGPAPRGDAGCLTTYESRALHFVYGSAGGVPRRARPARRMTCGPRNGN